MDDEEALKESVSNLRSSILLGRTDIVRSILSTAADYREEDGILGDNDEELDAQAKQVYYDEFDDPYDILKMMLNYVDNDAGTCLHLATKLGYADVVRALLAAGSNPTITNQEGATAFDYCTGKEILGVYNEELLQAAANSNVPRVRKLLKAGVSADASDGATSDNKALHWAASYGNAEIVKLFCEHGADVNVTNAAGATPLHDAVVRGNVDIAQVLLEHGASNEIVGKTGPCKGKLPSDMANSEEMKALFHTPVDQLLSNGELSSTKECDDAGDSTVSEGSSLQAAETETASSLTPVTPLSPLPAYARTQFNNMRKSQITLDPLFHHLWPPPQRIQQIKGERFTATSSLNIFIYRRLNADNNIHELCDIWNTLAGQYQQAGYSLDTNIALQGIETSTSAPGRIECRLCPDLFDIAESYRIRISAVKISIVASDTAALWHAANTVLQILRVFSGVGVPPVQINDWPDLKYRGVLVDVSTGRVPQVETLFSLIDILSSMKVNQLQLYMQNTFTFTNHETIWRNTTPYNQSDVIRIDQYCKARYIELVPHVESLSGFSHWVKFKAYRHLAEEPDTEYDPRQERPPSCLCPTSEDSLNLVRGLHSQVSPCFSSNRFVHVGMSLTEEFGRGKSYILAEAKGTDDLFMTYLKTIHNWCSGRLGRTVQFWSNALHENPEQLWKLPADTVAMEYTDQVNYDFTKYCSLLSEAGVSFFVCPGTLTWNSACGNSEDSFALVNEAVQAAVNWGALGVMLCDWSTPGHVNPLTCSFPAILAGTGLAWKASTEQDFLQSCLPEVLNKHVFMDKSGTFGGALVDLGKVHSLLNAAPTAGVRENSGVHPVGRTSEGTLLWKVLKSAGSAPLDGVNLDTIQKATRHIRQCQNIFTSADLQCVQSGPVVKELHSLVDLLLYACRLCRTALLAKKQGEVNTVSDLPPINKTDLANRLLGLIEHYQKVYLLRNKQGGIFSAVQLLQRILTNLLPENDEHVSLGQETK